jgi:MFS family permease
MVQSRTLLKVTSLGGFSLVTLDRHKEWKWIVFLVGFFTVFISFGIRYGYAMLMPEIMKSLNLSKTEAGLIFSSYLIVYTIFTPFTGFITDKFGPRKVITVLCLPIGIGTLLLGTANSMWSAILFAAVVGFGATSSWVPVVISVQSWFGIKRRGFVLGALQSGISLGIGFFGLLLPAVALLYGWRISWYILGFFGLLLVVANGLLLKAAGVSRSAKVDEQKAPSNFVTGNAKGQSTLLQRVFATRQFWLIGLSYFFIALAILVPMTFVTTYATLELKIEYTIANLFYSTMAFGGIVGALFLTAFSDRFGRGKAIMICCSAAVIGLLALIAAGPNQTMITLSVIIIGFSYGSIFPLYAACAFDYFSLEIIGVVTGLWTVCAGVGMTLSPIIAGYVADVTGTFTRSFFLAIIAAIVALVLISLVKRPSVGSF